MRSWRWPLLVAAAMLSGCADETAEGPTTSTGAGLTCAPAPECGAVERACLGLVDNAGLTRFGLRVAQIQLRKPAALATGIVGRVLGDDVRPKDPSCRLDGLGSFSWLLRFDTVAGSLEMGGARPAADPAAGYRFVTETVGGQPVAPVAFAARPDAEGRFAAIEARDLRMPMYLDRGAALVVVLPFRSVRVTSGALSASQGCIGAYNVEGLRPEDGCLPDADHAAFVNGGTLEGLLALEDADRVVLPSFDETLCVRLSADPETWGVRGDDGVLRCARDAEGAIRLRGDACTTPGASCADAFAVVADFAASAVRIAE